MFLKYKLFLFILSFACGILSFLPIMCGYHIPNSLDNDDNNHAINADIIEKLNFSMIVTSILLLFESFLDWNTLSISMDHTLPRWGLVFGGLLTSIIFYSFESSSPDHKLEVCICCFYSRACFFSGCLLFQMENQVSIFSQFMTLFVQLSLLTTAELWLWKSFFRVGETMMALSNTFGVLTGLICIYYLVRTTWIYGVQPLLYDSNTPSNIKKLRLMIASLCGIYIFGNFAITWSFGLKPWPETSSHEIMSYMIIDLFILIVTFHVPARMALVDAAFLQFQLQAKRAFVRYVGHEIRTPLNTVSLGLDLIQSNIKSYLEKICSVPEISILNHISRMVADVADSSNIATDILNDMLLYDKIEEGNIIIYPEKIETNQLLISLIKNFTIQAQHSQISLTFDQTISVNSTRREIIGVEIFADRSKISQVLRNFISNALKFTPSGGHVRVVQKFFPSVNSTTDNTIPLENKPNTLSSIMKEVVRSRTVSSAVFVTNVEDDPESGTGTNGILRIEVHDTGHGISKENQAKLFKSVIQFDTAALQGGKGSGLGLFISNAIVEQHEGRIGVVSSGVPGEGSIFFVELPALAHFQITLADGRSSYGEVLRSPRLLPLVNEEGENSVQDVPKVVEEIPRLKCALVVDDSRMNRKMLTQALSPHFDEILQAENGQEALEIYTNAVLNSQVISIIFMDYLMPVMSGIEATELLRRLGYGGPIIGVTGNVMKEDVDQFLSVGATEVIGKPLKLEKLYDLISNLHHSTVHSSNELHNDEKGLSRSQSETTPL